MDDKPRRVLKQNFLKTLLAKQNKDNQTTQYIPTNLLRNKIATIFVLSS